MPLQAFQADAASSASPGYGSAPYGQDLYDGPSYEDEPPYEDESFYDYSSYDEPYEPAPPMAGQGWDALQPASSNPASAVAGRTGAVGAGAPGEDPAALEALLQASFGASVTFSEAED